MTDDERSKFDQFLSRNTIVPAVGKLPYVHSTKSYNLDEMIKSSGLDPKFCKVFNEDLLYFFLGRPAYKEVDTGSEPAHWELPTCFIFNDLPSSPHRTFPFDSGAFEAGLYPSYLSSIPRKQFETPRADAASRIISAVFGDFKRYFEGNPKSETDVTSEFSLGATDAEILAVRRLADDGTPAAFDDRRFSVEVQIKSKVEFSEHPPSAVILPTPYLEDSDIRKKIELWGAEIINYDTYSLSLSLYYGIIFVKFTEYCRSNGFDA